MTDIKVNRLFWDWWTNGGSKEWADALNAEKGTLGALELVFTRGAQAAQNTKQDGAS